MEEIELKLARLTPVPSKPTREAEDMGSPEYFGVPFLQMRPMLFSLAFLAYAGLAASSRVVHGELSLPLSAMGWRSVGLPDPSELIKLTVGIRAPAAGRAELQVHFLARFFKNIC